MDTTVADFLRNAAAYLARVEQGEQVCLVDEGGVKARITPERAPSPLPVRDLAERARALRAEIGSDYGAEDDWTLADYVAAGRL